MLTGLLPVRQSRHTCSCGTRERAVQNPCQIQRFHSGSQPLALRPLQPHRLNAAETDADPTDRRSTASPCSSSSGSLPSVTLSRRGCLSIALAAMCLQERHASADVVRLEPTSIQPRLTPSERQILAINKRIQAQNNAPREFPYFVREGYNVRVLADQYVMDKDGLIYKDYDVGTGPSPVDGQEVQFHYTAYNESGGRIDSSFNKGGGKPSVVRLGINGLIPGFETGLKSMKVGGRRRLLVPPDLGPPVGPSTFFSAKQCEVFDVELLSVKACRRQQFGFTSKMVCDVDPAAEKRA